MTRAQTYVTPTTSLKFLSVRTLRSFFSVIRSNITPTRGFSNLGPRIYVHTIRIYVDRNRAILCSIETTPQMTCHLINRYLPYHNFMLSLQHAHILQLCQAMLPPTNFPLLPLTRPHQKNHPPPLAALATQLFRDAVVPAARRRLPWPRRQQGRSRPLMPHFFLRLMNHLSDLLMCTQVYLLSLLRPLSLNTNSVSAINVSKPKKRHLCGSRSGSRANLARISSPATRVIPHHLTKLHTSTYMRTICCLLFRNLQIGWHPTNFPS